MIGLSSLWPVGHRGYALKQAPATQNITFKAAAEERRKLLATDHCCWECDRPPGNDCWLLIMRMWCRPVGFLVCSRCVEKVRARRDGLRKTWFAPGGGK